MAMPQSWMGVALDLSWDEFPTNQAMFWVASPASPQCSAHDQTGYFKVAPGQASNARQGIRVSEEWESRT